MRETQRQRERGRERQRYTERGRQRKNVCLPGIQTYFLGTAFLIILLDSSQLLAVNHQGHHFFREIAARANIRRNVNFLEV